MKTTVVFAGNFGEFRNWCLDLGICNYQSNPFVRYAGRPETLRALDPKQCQCIMTGNYHTSDLWKSSEAQAFIRDSEWINEDEVQTQERGTSEADSLNQ